MDILQPQADLQPLVGSQKCCLQPEMDSLSVLKVWVRQGEPRPSLPAGFPVKKNIGPLFHFLNHSQDMKTSEISQFRSPQAHHQGRPQHQSVALQNPPRTKEFQNTKETDKWVSLTYQFVTICYNAGAKKTNFHHIFCLLLDISDDIFHLRLTQQWNSVCLIDQVTSWL